jgi:hypothetical protein
MLIYMSRARELGGSLKKGCGQFRFTMGVLREVKVLYIFT